VKELIENAIDSGADHIQLIVKDAGKSLIQVIDNGCGMSETDARMCFERHATSKIRKAEDLFAIRSMGFRGEAMASIAAIAQVELKTRRVEDELGTLLRIEGSEMIGQEAAASPAGTSISVKNLFYNTPARRNFLKSNSVELRHIMDEFQRVALAHPEIYFTLHHDGNEVFHLPPASLKQRVIHLFGNTYNQKLVPVEEETTIINLKGYVGKPEFAKKTRGEQFFFVNKRFVKDAYLNHAISSAFEEVLSKDSFPLYVLFIEIDPKQIDINVHPTKTEIKFQDEKALYAIIRSAVKRSLGRYNIAPTLDFNPESGFSQMITPMASEDIVPPKINFNPDFNPFDTRTEDKEPTFSRNLGQTKEKVDRNWASLYEITQMPEVPRQELGLESAEPKVQAGEKQIFQLHQRFILSTIKSGFMLIDQQAAHERILYEKFLEQLENHQGVCQQSLFPQTVSLSAADFELVKELMPDIQALGFQIREFGKHTVVVEGTPAEITSNISEAAMLEQLIEGFKNNQSALKLTKRDNLARTLAKNAAVKAGTVLSSEEINLMIDELFACQMPNVSLNAKPIVVTFGLDELIQKFEK
ncbi:MAG: DNA mismatch repair endonuclease MutL, partial [Sphingobacteriaceae bacterium]